MVPCYINEIMFQKVEIKYQKDSTESLGISREGWSLFFGWSEIFPWPEYEKLLH